MGVSEAPGAIDNVKNQKWGEPEYITCAKLGISQGTLIRLRKENRIPRHTYMLVSKNVMYETYRYDTKNLIDIIKEMRKNGEIKNRCRKKK
nr:MAG TPA: DNA binding domain-containing protein [Bacteriophage sp.]